MKTAAVIPFLTVKNATRLRVSVQAYEWHSLAKGTRGQTL